MPGWLWRTLPRERFEAQTWVRYTAPITTPTPAPGRTPAIASTWTGQEQERTIPSSRRGPLSTYPGPGARSTVGVDGATDWEALEDGAYFTTQVTIDNTDPEILQAAYSDGQLTCGGTGQPVSCRHCGLRCRRYAADRYVPNQTVEAQTQTATFNLGTLAEPGF